MKLRIFILLFAIYASQAISFAQGNSRETVYLHINSPLLLTGETLYYSAFVRSQATGAPSPLSQILYVELVGAGDKVVFQQKIKLDQGRGQGQFFVSSLVATGSYQLIAYTRWMKNFGDLFQMPLTLVNPFESYQPLPEAEASKLSVSYYPEGGQLVMGIANKVVYRIENGYGEGVSLAGRVVDEAGNKVAEIMSDHEGLGSFSFTPAEGAYQAILEDQDGEFLFFKLPKAVGSIPGIRLVDIGSEYKIEVIQSVDKPLSLVVSDGQNRVLETKGSGTFQASLAKDKLKTGVYQVKVLDGEDVLASRPFAHGTHPATIGKENLIASNREQVIFPLQVGERATVSISVRQKDNYSTIGADTYELLGNFSHRYQSGAALDNLILTVGKGFFPPEVRNDSVSLLPDLRGEWISGKILGLPEKPVAPIFAICGENYHFWSGKLEKDGSFSILADPVVGDQLAYLRVPQEGDFEFSMESPFLKTYPSWVYPPVQLDSTEAARLVKRSVLNQIENAYYKQKQDSSLAVSYWRPEMDQFDYFYRLDDYKRFPELYEYFIEYIPTVSARNNKRKSKINVFTEHVFSEDLGSLILLDGLPVTAEEVLNINPYLIESIGVINNRVFIGNLIVDGVVALHTYKHKLEGFEPIDNNLLKLEYQGLEPLYDYSFPAYDSASAYSRLPDYRTQLYWDPNVTLSGDSATALQFYTSDVEGDFEIQIEGYTQSGRPISIRKTLLVKAQAPD